MLRRRNRTDRHVAEDDDIDQQRSDREILDQQNRERRPPEAGHQLAPVEQQLDYENRRRQGDRRADHDGDIDFQAGRHCDDGDRKRRESDLRDAQKIHRRAEDLQPLDGKLQADRKKQEDDAEFGDGTQGFHIAHQPDAVGSDQDAGNKIAENRFEFHPLEHGDGNNRHGQDIDYVEQKLLIVNHASRAAMSCAFNLVWHNRNPSPWKLKRFQAISAVPSNPGWVRALLLRCPLLPLPPAR